MKFEGKEIAEVESRLAGVVGDKRIDSPLRVGEQVVVVVTGHVERVTHGAVSDKAVKRLQKVAISDGFVLTDETDAADLIHKLRAARKASLDELLGTPPLFEDDEPED